MLNTLRISCELQTQSDEHVNSTSTETTVGKKVIQSQTFETNSGIR